MDGRSRPAEENKLIWGVARIYINTATAWPQATEVVIAACQQKTGNRAKYETIERSLGRYEED